MQCWNCLKEIPEGSRSCSYCEAKQDRPGADPRTTEKALSEISAVDPELVDRLPEMALKHDTAEGFANAIFAGPCPACGSGNTETCEDVRGIEAIWAGRCIECGTVYCTDCGQVFPDDKPTVSSPECPACGSDNTDYPMDEGGMPPEIINCRECGAEYCFVCGKFLPVDQESQDDADNPEEPA